MTFTVRGAGSQGGHLEETTCHNVGPAFPCDFSKVHAPRNLMFLLHLRLLVISIKRGPAGLVSGRPHVQTLLDHLLKGIWDLPVLPQLTSVSMTDRHAVGPVSVGLPARPTRPGQGKAGW